MLLLLLPHLSHSHVCWQQPGQAPKLLLLLLLPAALPAPGSSRGANRPADRCCCCCWVGLLVWQQRQGAGSSAGAALLLQLLHVLHEALLPHVLPVLLQGQCDNSRSSRKGGTSIVRAG